ACATRKRSARCSPCLARVTRPARAATCASSSAVSATATTHRWPMSNWSTARRRPPSKRRRLSRSPKPRPRAGASFFAYLCPMTANPLRWAFRIQCFAGFAACALLIGYAVFLQFSAHLEPCPLCIFQRIAFAALGLVFLLAGLHAPRGAGGRRGWGALALLAAAAGIGIAGRHVWLQH